VTEFPICTRNFRLHFIPLNFNYIPLHTTMETSYPHRLQTGKNKVGWRGITKKILKKAAAAAFLPRLHFLIFRVILP